MQQRLIILGGILALVGSGCETSRGNSDQIGRTRSGEDILTEASATDRAETASVKTDSLAVILADTVSQSR